MEDADVALPQLSSAVLVHDLPPAVPSFFSSAQLLPSADAEDEHAYSDVFVRVRRIHRGSYVHRARFKRAILVHKLAAALVRSRQAEAEASAAAPSDDDILAMLPPPSRRDDGDVSLASRHLITRANRIQLPLPSNWVAPLTVKQRLSEYAESFVERHKAVVAEAAAAFDELQSSSSLAAPVDFDARIKELRRHRLAFLQTFERADSESVPMLPPEAPCDLELVATSHHDCMVQWRWEKDKVRWVGNTLRLTSPGGLAAPPSLARRRRSSMRLISSTPSLHNISSSGSSSQGTGYYEAEAVFLLECCYISPAYGAMTPWRRVAKPTRRLVTSVTFPPPSEWDDHPHTKAGRGRVSLASAVAERGPLDDLALRVRAVTRGGTSLASNVVVVQPARTRRALVLDSPPGVLPDRARGLLSVEDLLCSTSKEPGGLSPDVQWHRLRAALVKTMPALSQLFRLFALAFSTKVSSMYTMSRAQFRGFMIALGVSPSPLPFSHLAVIFAKSHRILKSDEAASALGKEGAETHGHRSDRGVGITQFVSALVRVAHALFPRVHSQGLGEQILAFAEQYATPLHEKVAIPTRWDVFLRSRSARAVYEAHRPALHTLFRRFTALDTGSAFARQHVLSMNALEWLTMLTVGGWFEHAKPNNQTNATHKPSADGVSANLTQFQAIRIFVEVNLEDVQLDLVKEDSGCDDLYSEVVFDEFLLCIGSLMPHCDWVCKEAQEAPKGREQNLAQLLDTFIVDDLLPRYDLQYMGILGHVAHQPGVIEPSCLAAQASAMAQRHRLVVGEALAHQPQRTAPAEALHVSDAPAVMAQIRAYRSTSLLSKESGAARALSTAVTNVTEATATTADEWVEASMRGGANQKLASLCQQWPFGIDLAAEGKLCQEESARTEDAQSKDAFRRYSDYQ